MTAMTAANTAPGMRKLLQAAGERCAGGWDALSA
jgi:hypothetical protein